MPYLVQPQRVALDFDAELKAFMEDCASGKLAQVPVAPLSDANKRLLSGVAVTASGMATHPGLPPLPRRTDSTSTGISTQQVLWGSDVMAAEGRETSHDWERKAAGPRGSWQLAAVSRQGKQGTPAHTVYLAKESSQPDMQQLAIADDSGGPSDEVVGPEQGVLPPMIGISGEGALPIGLWEPDSSASPAPASATQQTALLSACFGSVGDTLSSQWGTDIESAQGGAPLFEDTQPVAPHFAGNPQDFLQLALRAVAESTAWPGVAGGRPSLSGTKGPLLDIAGYQPTVGPGVPEVIGGPQQTTPILLKKKVRKKARILKDGQLTLIVYGAEEAFKWERRVASFLTAVRGVLGDRVLVHGQWKGSILDSVVGAFLTQNVTDALSSKAYMTLAARFPVTVKPTAWQDSLASDPFRVPDNLYKDSLAAAVPAALPPQDSLAPKPSERVREPCSQREDSLAPDLSDCAAERNSLAFKADEPRTQHDDLASVREMPDPQHDRMAPLPSPKRPAEVVAELPAKRPRTQEAVHLAATRATGAEDSVNWKAVRSAPPEQLADAIRCRGMYNSLVTRIQGMLNRIWREGPGLAPPPCDPISLLAATSDSPPAADAAAGPPPAANELQPDVAFQSVNAQQPDGAQHGIARQPNNDADSLDMLAAMAVDSELPPAEEKLHNQAAFAEHLPGPCLATSPAAFVHTAGENVKAAQMVGSELEERPEHASSECVKSSLDKRVSEGHEAGELTLLVELEEPSGKQMSEDEEAQLAVHPAPPDEQETRPPRQQLSGDLGTFPAEQIPLVAPATGQSSAEQAIMVGEEHAHVSTQQGAEEDLDSVELSDDDMSQGGGSREGLREKGFPLDLEWLRAENVEDVRNYLMGIEGLGRKSVACILLLALGMKDFPVDTNVGRISARLGWIPLDAENLLEDLDDYAPEPEVHKYLHSRLMRFPIPVLYELHYHMITLGKVFCSKRDPNCSACPLQDQCEYALNNGRRRKHHAAAEADTTIAPLSPPATPANDISADTAQEARCPIAAPAAELPGAIAATTVWTASPPNADATVQIMAIDVAKEKAAGSGIASPAEAASAAASGVASPAEDAAERGILTTSAATAAAEEQVTGQASAAASAVAEMLLGGMHYTEDNGSPSTREEELQDASGAAEAMDSDATAVEASAMDIEDLCCAGVSAPTIMQAAAGRDPTAELARILEAGNALDASLALRDTLVADGNAERADSLKNRRLSEAARVLDIDNDHTIPIDVPGDSPSSRSESAADAPSADQGAKPLPPLTAAVERKRFLELSVLMHPDKNPHPLAEQAFGTLKRAHGVLVEHFAMRTQAEGASARAADETPAEIPSNISRLVIEAWDVPRSARRLLPDSITAYHTRADFPFLLIRVPASAHKAAQQQPLSPQFSQVSGVAALGAPSGGQSRAQQPLSPQLSQPSGVATTGVLSEEHAGAQQLLCSHSPQISGMEASDLPPGCSPGTQPHSPCLSPTSRLEASDAAPGVKCAAQQESGTGLSQAVSTAQEPEPSSQSCRTFEISHEDDLLRVEAPDSTAVAPSTEEAGQTSAAVNGRGPNSQPEGLCAAIARRLFDFGSTLTGFPKLSITAAALTPVSGKSSLPAASSAVTAAAHERLESAETAACRRADADAQPRLHEDAWEEENREDGRSGDIQPGSEPPLAATADLTEPRLPLSGEPAQMDLKRPAEGQADIWPLFTPKPEMSRARSHGDLAEMNAGGHAERKLVAACGVSRRQGEVTQSEDDRPMNGDLTATTKGPRMQSGVPWMEGDKPEDGDLAAAVRGPWSQRGVARMEEDRSEDGVPAASLGGLRSQGGVAPMEEDRPAEGQAAVERPRFALLVPCRVAMKGRFPLNGTYFQTNELFLDLESCQEAKFEVDDAETATWRRRLVLFGSSIGSICRGMTQRQVSRLFKEGFICVRSYQPASGMPQHLPGWLQPGGAKPPLTPRRRKGDSLSSSRAIARLLANHGDARLSATQGVGDLLTVQTPKRRGRPPKALVAAKSASLGCAASNATFLSVGGCPGSVANYDLWTPERYKAKQAAQAKENGSGRSRVQVLPKIRASERCGHCRSCLNRSMKKACFTRRAEMLAAMEADGLTIAA